MVSFTDGVAIHSSLQSVLQHSYDGRKYNLLNKNKTVQVQTHERNEHRSNITRAKAKFCLAILHNDDTHK